MALSVALQLEDMTLNTRRLIEVRIEIAVVYTRLGHQSDALEYYNDALSLVTESHTFEKARIIGNIGLLHQSFGDFDKSIEAYEQALKLFGDLTLLDKCASIKGNLGTIYFQQHDFTKALSHFEEAIQLAKLVNNQGNKGVLVGNKGRCRSTQSNPTGYR